jgi:hypothetical protein
MGGGPDGPPNLPQNRVAPAKPELSRRGPDGPLRCLPQNRIAPAKPALEQGACPTRYEPVIRAVPAGRRD